MANIETKKSKNVVELKKDLANMYIEHLYLNGQNTGICLCSMNTTDREIGIETISKAIESSNGDIYEALSKINNIATFTDKEVTPDDQIYIGGLDLVINYNNKAAYTLDGDEFVNCRDVQCDMPAEAIKALLISRADAYINKYDEDDED